LRGAGDENRNAGRGIRGRLRNQFGRKMDDAVTNEAEETLEDEDEGKDEEVERKIPMYTTPEIRIGSLLKPDNHISTTKKPTVGTLHFYPHTGTNIMIPSTMQKTSLLGTPTDS
jgi:hypothetical protein